MQPVTQHERDMVAKNKCPRCREALDTGYECTGCGYDAQPIAHAETCARCGGSGWIDGKDYMDGSFSTDRPCPKCSGIIITD